MLERCVFGTYWFATYVSALFYSNFLLFMLCQFKLWLLLYFVHDKFIRHDYSLIRHDYSNSDETTRCEGIVVSLLCQRTQLPVTHTIVPIYYAWYTWHLTLTLHHCIRRTSLCRYNLLCFEVIGKNAKIAMPIAPPCHFII